MSLSTFQVILSQSLLVQFISFNTLVNIDIQKSLSTLNPLYTMVSLGDWKYIQTETVQMHMETTSVCSWRCKKASPLKLILMNTELKW